MQRRQPFLRAATSRSYFCGTIRYCPQFDPAPPTCLVSRNTIYPLFRCRIGALLSHSQLNRQLVICYITAPVSVESQALSITSLDIAAAGATEGSPDISISSPLTHPIPPPTVSLMAL